MVLPLGCVPEAEHHAYVYRINQRARLSHDPYIDIELHNYLWIEGQYSSELLPLISYLYFFIRF